MAPITWPPQLTHVKIDMGLAADDTRDDQRLQLVLDAAIAKVVELRGATVNFGGGSSVLPPPGPDLGLGTVRLAIRWHTRRRSPDGLVQAGDLGTSRVGSGDPDIDRLLRIGRYALPVLA